MGQATHGSHQELKEHSEPISDGLGKKSNLGLWRSCAKQPHLEGVLVTVLQPSTQFLKEPFILIYLLFHLRVKLVRDTERQKKCSLFLPNPEYLLPTHAGGAETLPRRQGPARATSHLIVKRNKTTLLPSWTSSPLN